MTANVHPAPLQLVDLAVAMRPDWDRDVLAGAIAGVRETWAWPRIFAEVARLLVIDGSSPRDLTEAARDRTGPRTPADPEMTRECAAAARELLAAVKRGAAA